ncbi:MAG: hypothetical protein P8Y16_07480, partial [Sulfurimonas sp.]
MNNIINLLCEKNKISYIIFDKEYKIIEFSETLENIADDKKQLGIGQDIREVLWETIGLEEELDALYNGGKQNSLHFPMILKANEYYDLDIETFTEAPDEKRFIAYAIQKPKESLAYLTMVKEINKKTLIYEIEDKKSKQQHFDLINQKLLNFNV